MGVLRSIFTNIKNSPRASLILLIIIIIAATLRLYKLDQVPPAISWDEASVGYNAYTIGNWGRDEWGKLFPTSFKSFGDDKSPVHIYMTAVTVKLFGLSEFSTRLSAALFGVFNVIVIFFLARLLFQSPIVGLAAAFSLAVSPYAVQFSRFNHELNFTIFFFIFGLWMFFESLHGKTKLLLLSFFSFGVSILSYHSAKIVVPPLLLVLVVMYFKDLLKIKEVFLMSIAVLMLVLSAVIFNPALLGTARAQQTLIGEDKILKTELYQKTHSKFWGGLEVMYNQYIVHFTPEYLFISGDKIPRHSSQTTGEFYKIDALLIIAGLLGLLIKRSKVSLLLILWILLAPLPVAPTGGADGGGHAGRGLFLMGSMHLISAYGFYLILSLLKKPLLKVVFVALIIFLIGFQFKDYIYDYYNNYNKRYAIEWQYGMKQIAQYVKEHDGYMQVYITDARVQPYIFLLYYMQVPLPKFLETVYYNDQPSKLSNVVTFFDKYHFGDWDPIESFPSPGVLYVVTPSQYDGLRYKSQFQVKKLIKYPNGLDAFFLVALY